MTRARQEIEELGYGYSDGGKYDGMAYFCD